MSFTRTKPSPAVMAARSRILRSSRTLPGQLERCKRSSTSPSIPVTRGPCFLVRFCSIIGLWPNGACRGHLGTSLMPELHESRSRQGRRRCSSWNGAPVHVNRDSQGTFAPIPLDRRAPNCPDAGCRATPPRVPRKHPIMDVEGILGELRQELDAIEAAILSLEHLYRPANLSPDRRLDCSTRSRTEGTNGFHRNPEPEQIS